MPTLLNKKLFTLFAFYIMHSIVSTTHAFDVDKVKAEITLELSKDLNGSQKNKPILLLIGGYPGAGKTTLIHALLQNHDMALISWNAIRQLLVDRRIKGSPFDWEIIEAVNRNLMRTCLQRQVNIVIDANAHAHNIQLFEDLLKEECYQDTYRLVKICLNPPIETLLIRMRAREQKEGMHQGTEKDLINDLYSAHKKIDMNNYSLIIKNDDELPLDSELKIVNSYLESVCDNWK